MNCPEGPLRWRPAGPVLPARPDHEGDQQDWGGSGVADGTVLKISGATIVKTNNLPQTNVSTGRRPTGRLHQHGFGRVAERAAGTLSARSPRASWRGNKRATLLVASTRSTTASCARTPYSWRSPNLPTKNRGHRSSCFSFAFSGHPLADDIVSLIPTTELEAVNICSTPSASNRQPHRHRGTGRRHGSPQTAHRQQSVQLIGWDWNTDENVTITPTVDGF